MWKCWWKMTRLSPSAAKKSKKMAAKDRVTIGKVGAAHGIHGENYLIVSARDILAILG